MKRQNKGFTLTEVLIYIAVSSIIMLAVSGFFLWSNKTHAKAKAVREVLGESQRMMETMGYEIRHAQSVYGPTSVFASSTGQLSLKTVHYTQAGEAAGYIDFFICNAQLCLKKENQSPVVISSENVKIDQLRFFRVNASTNTDSIQIGLDISYNAVSQKQEYQASMNVTSTFAIR